MSEILDDNSGVTSSDDATLDGAADQQLDNGQQNGAVGADSSDAQGDNADQDLGTLDIVKDVVTKGREQATASPADGSEQGTDKPKEADDEEYSDVPFHKHPRFQHLLRAKKSADTDAGRYRNVQKFMDDNGISAEESANAFTFMAAFRRGEYAKAWELIKPTVQHLLVAAGEVVPDDLREEVAAGTITQERAQELARERAKSKSLETGRTFDQQAQQRRQQQEASQALYDTATGWASQRAKTDPQFAAKQPLLMKEVAWLQSQEGKPDTPEGVRAQLEKAYKAVVLPAARSASGQFVPKVGDGAARRQPTAGGGNSGTAQPKPKTTLDIINSVVGRRAG